MIPVAEALERLLALVAPLEAETVPLRAAHGRVLARDARALRTQPPFSAAAMDGYAVADEGLAPGARYRVIGDSAAGARFAGALGPGEAVRIFTGAPVPAAATHVVIQEDVTRDGDSITVTDRLGAGRNIRPEGGDFRKGAVLLSAPRRLGPADLALLAAMGHATVAVHRRPEVALICTGDELAMPGEPLGPDQIVVSNAFGLAAMIEAAGGIPRLLPIARDTEESHAQILGLAQGADLVVTCGGASVGDRDLVAKVAMALGAELGFHKVAIRPGKPLMAGRLFDRPMIGLPGNPVSAMVCGQVFLQPVLAAMQGLPARPASRLRTVLATDLPANGPRDHYMRALLSPAGISVLPDQDSSLLSVLSRADALLIRPAGEGARKAGEPAEYLPL